MNTNTAQDIAAIVGPNMKKKVKLLGTKEMSIVKLRKKSPARLRFEKRVRDVVIQLRAHVMPITGSDTEIRIDERDLKKLLGVSQLREHQFEEFDTTCWENDMVLTKIEGCYVLSPVDRLMAIDELPKDVLNEMIASVK